MKLITIKQSLTISGGAPNECLDLFCDLMVLFFGNTTSTNTTHYGYANTTYSNSSYGNWTYGNSTYAYNSSSW